MNDMMALWIILGSVSAIGLIYAFVVGKKSIWLGWAAGLIIGTIFASGPSLSGSFFNWSMVLQGGIIGGNLGIIFSFFERHS